MERQGGDMVIVLVEESVENIRGDMLMEKGLLRWHLPTLLYHCHNVFSCCCCERYKVRRRYGRFG